ncbi:hypothetical protein [Aquimarina sp. 2201CG5-10]|uniref:hypothetical protein n=1 Tax=Aquimarina callyspongiae TaxID=3098150 RepID=UPI002AB584E1|nr:hypothetical protein [Aquimarina sp. 2201CG5-10]MDY8136682.1 hypothetical protein [Aquimarina sp. 2201CG5-10]
MKIRSFFILVTLFFSLHNYSQSNVRPASDLAGGYNFSVPEIYHTQRIKQEFFDQIAKDIKIDPKDLKGTPYLYDTFLPGKISDDLTGKKVDVYLRYNVYNDIFEVKYDLSSDEIFGFLKNTGYHAEINSDKFFYKAFPDDKNATKEGYLQELMKTDNFILYKRHYQKLHMPKPAKTSLETDVPGRISDHQHYYLRSGEKFLLLPMNKKKIANAFPKHQNELKSFIKKEKLKFKQEKDLITLIKYFNTL